MLEESGNLPRNHNRREATQHSAAQHSTAQRHDAFSNVLCSWLCKRGEATTAPVCMPFRCVLTLLDRTGQTQLILSVSYILPYHHTSTPFHSTTINHQTPPPWSFCERPASSTSPFWLPGCIGISSSSSWISITTLPLPSLSSLMKEGRSSLTPFWAWFLTFVSSV